MQVTAKEAGDAFVQAQPAYNKLLAFSKTLLAVCEANGISVDKNTKKLKNIKVD